MWGDCQDRQLHEQAPAVCATQSRKSRHNCETGGNVFQAFGTFLGAGYPQRWWHSEEEEGEEGQIQSVGGKKFSRSDDPFWSRHYQHSMWPWTKNANRWLLTNEEQKHSHSLSALGTKFYSSVEWVDLSMKGIPVMNFQLFWPPSPIARRTLRKSAAFLWPGK